MAREPWRGSFVGREDDVAAIEGAIARGARLVTVLGPGGVGKTRLLHRLVQRLGPSFGGASFVDLTSARTAGDVAARVAAGVSGAGAGAAAPEIAARVARALARRGPTLLALDNLEQLADAHDALALLGEWLSRADRLVVLTTSRVTLGVAGEVVHRLGPLAVARDASGSAPALRLLEERASAVREPFTADEMPAVERIVELLEGMPLAIELAAARLSVLRPKDLLERLARPLDVLAKARPRDPDRHASVARVLDGSWELLGAAERRALADLGVFVGGFSVEAAEAVVDLDGGALDALARLVDSSLLRALPSRTGRARHAPWEVVREYALERLAAESRLDATRRRHAAWFAAWAETRLARIESDAPAGDDAKDALAELVDDEANLAAAAAWAASAEDHDLALRLLCALEPVRMLRGQLDVLAREIAASQHVLPGANAGLLARSHLARARALHELGRPAEAAPAYDRAIATAEAAGDPTGVGLALVGLGRLVAGLGEWSRACALFDDARSRPGAALRVRRLARACFEFYGTEIGASRDVRAAVADYVDVCRRGADPRELAFWLVQLGRVESELVRDAPAATRRFDEALALARAAGDLRGEGFALFGLGTHHVAYGELDRAEDVLPRAAAALHEAGTRRYEAWARGFLGVARALRGAFDDAIVTLDGAIALTREVGDAPREAHLRAYRAAALARQGAIARAEDDIAEARRAAPPESRYHAWTIDLSAAQIDVARSREALARGDAGAARAFAAAAEDVLARAGWPRGGAPEVRAWPWGGEFFEPRLAAALLEDALAAPAGALRVARDASFFVLPSGARVACPGRGRLQRILAVLAEARSGRPGSAVRAAELVEAAWGGERIKREAAANRLHVALDNLRKAGLRGLLLRGDGGWLLDPAVPFTWEAAPDEEGN